MRKTLNELENSLMDTLTRVYHVWKTVLDMLKDRGYVTNDLDHQTTLDEFRERVGVGADGVDRGKLTIKAVREGSADDGIIVLFAKDDKMKTEVFRSYAEEVQGQECKRAIVVYRGQLSSVIVQFVNSSEQKVKWELLLEDELIVNVTKHVLVPEHIKLTDEEKQAVLKKYQVKESQLPRLLKSDPIAKYYGFERGDVIKIIRKSETAGRYVTYRAVF
ncbi:DNA-directed RNA polymerase I, II, and III subunit RPABC1, putative [Entamoeba invadens IP1]|uniref:DNA-directed RNA polymerase I, II, and III subunit RPABC1, putative n=1 Tax=Entamoeba invadens IP1 TaxID=370355 RepID=A0A0A1UGE4_ENTIV|nr:DNA-directed RNA polymerase I, II, and III subunit RPABC1, putative [Entamoeba invadens IP1]ELP94824.1 DNA-directed RNA polymerase I, II, and III subunit RPABC1, putative [Entamoeba invadens IP1]|eukprot:XP_004261595.1 DNA-directed RNA polymerase I, II, and III subunit RPABC1, putative [Entamoeba invadens IP1]